jgi:hypothetical protein
MPVAKTLTIRGYARHRGCSHQAVRQAIKRNRLVNSIVRDAAGRVVIVDARAADKEWAERTLGKAPNAIRERDADRERARTGAANRGTTIPLNRLSAFKLGGLIHVAMLSSADGTDLEQVFSLEPRTARALAAGLWEAAGGRWEP